MKHYWIFILIIAVVLGLPARNPGQAQLPIANPVSATSTPFCLKVPVLLYHHIAPRKPDMTEVRKRLTVDTENFEKQMKYLTDHGYTPIGADELAKHLITRQTISGKPIVITLDDAYDDAYTQAFPIAKKYNIRLNLMIPVGLLGKPEYLHWKELKEMVDSGVVYAFNHTWSHFPLNTGDKHKIMAEVMSAQAALDGRRMTPARVLTYPYGAFNNEVIEIIKKQGFLGAFSTRAGFMQCDSELFTLHRNHIGNLPLSAYGL